jgi:hypothetical protein
MEEIIFLVEESPEGGYTARALGFSIITESESIHELKQKIKDAIQSHFDESKTRLVQLRMVKEEFFAA